MAIPDNLHRENFRVNDGNLRPVGYQQILAATLATATALTLASLNGVRARMCLIVAEGAPVRWTDDGSTPTATVGMPLEDGVYFWYNGDPAALQFILESGAPKLNVSYYA